MQPQRRPGTMRACDLRASLSRLGADDSGASPAVLLQRLQRARAGAAFRHSLHATSSLPLPTFASIAARDRRRRSDLLAGSASHVAVASDSCCSALLDESDPPPANSVAEAAAAELAVKEQREGRASEFPAAEMHSRPSTAWREGEGGALQLATQPCSGPLDQISYSSEEESAALPGPGSGPRSAGRRSNDAARSCGDPWRVRGRRLRWSARACGAIEGHGEWLPGETGIGCRPGFWSRRPQHAREASPGCVALIAGETPLEAEQARRAEALGATCVLHLRLGLSPDEPRAIELKPAHEWVGIPCVELRGRPAQILLERQLHSGSVCASHRRHHQLSPFQLPCRERRFAAPGASAASYHQRAAAAARPGRPKAKSDCSRDRSCCTGTVGRSSGVDPGAGTS